MYVHSFDSISFKPTSGVVKFLQTYNFTREGGKKGEEKKKDNSFVHAVLVESNLSLRVNVFLHLINFTTFSFYFCKQI